MLYYLISQINIVTEYNCTILINKRSRLRKRYRMTNDAMLRSTEFLTGNLFRKDRLFGRYIDPVTKTNDRRL